MKLIIAGGRDYVFSALDMQRLDSLHKEHSISEVVHGGCTGTDAAGEYWANCRGIPAREFPPDWKAHGRAAGPIRNRQMAEYADAVALFPGGRGTASMAAEAARAGIQSFDYRA